MPHPARNEMPWERTVKAEEFESGEVELREGDRVVGFRKEEKRRCGFAKKNDDGTYTPCLAPQEFLQSEYWYLCPAHPPGNAEIQARAETASDRAKKARKRRKGIYELPDFNTVEEANAALKDALIAFAAGELKADKFTKIRMALKDWTKMRETELEERLETMEEKMEEMEDKMEGGGHRL